MARLRRTHPGQPGLTRRRRGSGWEYLDADGSRITDPGTRQRIRKLVIPPAWQDVWIIPAANGHLQAVGTDAAGWRQYLPSDRPWSNLGLDAAVRRSVEAVAATLGNTPAVCRNSYINTRVLGLFRQGTTIDRAVARPRRSLPTLTASNSEPAEPKVVAAIGGTPIAERAVLRLLTD